MPQTELLGTHSLDPKLQASEHQFAGIARFDHWSSAACSIGRIYIGGIYRHMWNICEFTVLGVLK